MTSSTEAPRDETREGWLRDAPKIPPSEDPMTNPNLDLEALVGAAEASIKAEECWWDDADQTAKILEPYVLIGEWAVLDASFIALANPSTILALVSRLQNLTDENEILRGAADEHALFDAETDVAFKDLDAQIANQAEEIRDLTVGYQAMEARATTAEAALTQRDEVIANLVDCLKTARDYVSDEYARSRYDMTKDDLARINAAIALTASRAPPEKGEG